MKAAFWSTACLLISLMLCTKTAAQATHPDDAGASTSPMRLQIRDGTEVVLKFGQDVNSWTANEGEPVEFVVAEAVKVRDVVVADVRSRAIGMVVHSTKPDSWGNPGELTVQLTTLKVGRVKVPLRGSISRVGSARGGLLRGGAGMIQQGTLIKAYVGADTEIETALPEARQSPSAALASLIPAPEDFTDLADKILLPNGTPVKLLLTQPLSSETATVGDKVAVQVLDAVKIGDLVVIVNKAPASGTITEVKPAGRVWHKGTLAIRLNSVTLVNQQQLALEFASDVSGGPTDAARQWISAIDETGGAAIFALPFAPLQHGNQATLRSGTVLDAVTRGELLLDRTSIEKSQPKELAKNRGPASVTFYCPDFGCRYSHEIWCGGAKLVNLKQGRKFTIKLPTGRYHFRLRKKAPSMPLDLQEGGEYYLRLDSSEATVPPYSIKTELTPVPHDIGEIEAAETRASESKSIPDLTRLDLALLQLESPMKK